MVQVYMLCNVKDGNNWQLLHALPSSSKSAARAMFSVTRRGSECLNYILLTTPGNTRMSMQCATSARGICHVIVTCNC
jgi:hypothetical protein